MLHGLVKLQDLSDEVAWEIVTPLFKQRITVVISGAMYTLFGLLGACTSGNRLYVVGGVYAVAVTLWRLQQSVGFEARSRTDEPSDWAVKGLKSAWAMAIGWSCWASLAAVEPEPRLVGILFGIQAALVITAAVMNSSVPIIAQGQVILSAVPLGFACLLSGNVYSEFYAVIVAVQTAAALTLVRSLHQAKLRTLSNEVQALELSTKLAAAIEELEVVNQHLKQQVATDPLTGLLNRRAFDLAAAREWRSAMREERLLTVLMVDVDHFKTYNDRYGHQAGDVCLRTIAESLSAVLQRPGDILARYGGEEFIAILPSTDEDGAAIVAGRVLDHLADRAIPHAQSPLGRITVSIGMSAIVVTPSQSLTALVEIADQALYEAKRGGRNQIVVRAAELAPLSLLQPGRMDHALDELFLFTPQQAGGL